MTGGVSQLVPFVATYCRALQTAKIPPTEFSTRLDRPLSTLCVTQVSCPRRAHTNAQHGQTTRYSVDQRNRQFMLLNRIFE
jgi:hypothetical protein